MANPSVQQDIHGPDWPLGLIVVAAAGTPVGIMSLVDSSSLDDPGNPTAAGVSEYTSRGFTLLFTPCRKGAANHGTQNNVGNIYIVRKGNSGTGNRDDYGSIVAVLRPTDAPLAFPFHAMTKDVFSPYRYSIDADNANDGAMVTMFIG